MWVPLPGPFAITSGQRRPRNRSMTRAHQRGMFYWPALPVSPSIFTVLFWCLVVALAVLWNVGVAVALGGMLIVRKVRPERPEREGPPPEPRRFDIMECMPERMRR